MNGWVESSMRMTLRCGTPVVIKRITRDDAPSLAEGLARLSPASRMQRFFFNKSCYSEEELRRFTETDDDRHLALGAAVTNGLGHPIQPVAVARCFRSHENPAVAEVAFVTIDAWQRRGIGTLLLRALAARAWLAGVRRWTAVFTTENAATPRLLARVGAIVLHPLDVDYVESVCTLSDPACRAEQTSVA